jgi:predicted XRE-type DNA-binding protein
MKSETMNKPADSSETVFRDSDVPSAETANIRIRSLLMARLRDMMESRKLTQVEAAHWFCVSQPRVSHLVRGRVNRFSTDALINMLSHAGVRVSLVLQHDPWISSDERKVG